MGLFGNKNSRTRAELRIIKKENVELKAQLMSNYNSLQRLQIKLDDAQSDLAVSDTRLTGKEREIELLSTQNDKLHEENNGLQKTMRSLIREVRKTKGRYEREHGRCKILERETEKLIKNMGKCQHQPQHGSNSNDESS